MLLVLTALGLSFAGGALCGEPLRSAIVRRCAAISLTVARRTLWASQMSLACHNRLRHIVSGSVLRPDAAPRVERPHVVTSPAPSFVPTPRDTEMAAAAAAHNVLIVRTYGNRAVMFQVHGRGTC